jgi:Cysteine-rich secretory protein family
MPIFLFALALASSDASIERSDAAMRRAVLDRHNAARTERGATALRWSETLAADARVHAERIARSGRFEHDPQTGVAARQGENLYTGTAGGFTYDEMIDAWLDQRAPFRPGRFPAVSRTGRWHDVAHYTQIVWPTTRELGCALASNARDDVLVCRYRPAGNIVGIVLR